MTVRYALSSLTFLSSSLPRVIGPRLTVSSLVLALPPPVALPSCQSLTRFAPSTHYERPTGRRGCRGTEPETTEGARMSGKGALHR